MKRPTNSRTTQGGFTLLEVLATVAIVGLAMSILLLERNRTVKRAAETDELRLATQLARNKMNEILLGEETGGGNFEDVDGFSWEVTEGVETFGEETVQVTLTVLRLTVTYDDGKHEVTLEAVSEGRQ